MGKQGRFRLPYDFDYIAGIVKKTEGSNEDVKEMKESVRQKIKAIFDVCYLFLD